MQAVVDDYTRPVGRRMMTADLRALYPRDTEDQAVLRPLTRNRSAPPYERARLAADALRVRGHAVRRADRLGSRTRPRAVAVPALRSRPRPFHSNWKAGRVPEQTTDVATVEQTRRTLSEAALARVLEGARERAVHDLRPQPAPETAPPSHAQHPGTHRAGPQEESREHPGRTTQPNGSPRPRPRSR